VAKGILLKKKKKKHKNQFLLTITKQKEIFYQSKENIFTLKNICLFFIPYMHNLKVICMSIPLFTWSGSGVFAYTCVIGNLVNTSIII
jgi:multidrug transporter EmrE-like cation transporter